MSLDALIAERKAADAAIGNLRKVAKETIGEELDSLFLRFEDINKVQWAQKNSPYNDEGMSEGIHGPVVNDDFEEDYGAPEWAYGYGTFSPDNRTDTLRSILNTLGEEILSDIFGDENLVTAVRETDGTVKVTSDYAGW